MSPKIRPGARVRVVSASELVRQGCHHKHYLHGVVLDGAVGVVDRIDPRYGKHRVVAEFPTVTTQPFGTAWADCFGADELEIAEPEYAF